MVRFANQVVCITGAAGGLGLATAEAFAREGGRLILADIDEVACIAAAARLTAGGAVVRPMRHDVSSQQDWAQLSQSISATEGRLDVLVNNAGVEAIGPIAGISVEQLRRVLDVNVVGAFLGHQMAAGLMPSGGGGTVVNIASVAGSKAQAMQSVYSLSKAAVVMLSKAAAIEFGRSGLGIRVNSVSPGVIDGGATRRIMGEFSRSMPGQVTIEEAVEMARQMHPIGRLGEPEDIAQAVLYLASQEASFTTGVDLLVDGGFSA